MPLKAVLFVNCLSLLIIVILPSLSIGKPLLGDMSQSYTRHVIHHRMSIPGKSSKHPRIQKHLLYNLLKLMIDNHIKPGRMKNEHRLNFRNYIKYLLKDGKDKIDGSISGFLRDYEDLVEPKYNDAEKPIKRTLYSIQDNEKIKDLIKKELDKNEPSSYAMIGHIVKRKALIPISLRHESAIFKKFDGKHRTTVKYIVIDTTDPNKTSEINTELSVEFNSSDAIKHKKCGNPSNPIQACTEDNETTTSPTSEVVEESSKTTGCHNFVTCAYPYISYLAVFIMIILVLYLVVVFGRCVCDDTN